MPQETNFSPPSPLSHCLCLRMGQLCSTKLCSLTWFPPLPSCLPPLPSCLSLRTLLCIVCLIPATACPRLATQTHTHTHTLQLQLYLVSLGCSCICVCVCVCVFNVLGFMFVERTKMTLHWVNKIFVTLRALPASQGRTWGQRGCRGHKGVACVLQWQFSLLPVCVSVVGGRRLNGLL